MTQALKAVYDTDSQHSNLECCLFYLK